MDESFTERELELIEACVRYAENGVEIGDAHNLKIIIAKYARQMADYWDNKFADRNQMGQR